MFIGISTKVLFMFVYLRDTCWHLHWAFPWLRDFAEKITTIYLVLLLVCFFPSWSTMDQLQHLLAFLVLPLLLLLCRCLSFLSSVQSILFSSSLKYLNVSNPLRKVCSTLLQPRILYYWIFFHFVSIIPVFTIFLVMLTNYSLGYKL